MDSQQRLRSNLPCHSGHGFPPYDHHRSENVSGREHVRESDLLSTIIGFPSSTSCTQPFLLSRNALQQRHPGSQLVQNSSSAAVSFDAGTSRDESLQINMLDRDVACESTLAGSLEADKLRDHHSKRALSGFGLGYNGDHNVLARFAVNNSGLVSGGPEQCREEIWSYSDRNDVGGPMQSGSAASSHNAGFLHVPSSSTRLGENLPSYPAAHQHVLSAMFQGHKEPGGSATSYTSASRAHGRDIVWGDDHSTELLLLPGVSGHDNMGSGHVSSDHHNRTSVPQAGGTRPSLLVDNLKPLDEYLDMHSSDQVREQSPNFNQGAVSAYDMTSGSISLRGLSLSLSAQESSQHVLLGGSTGPPGSSSCNLQSSGLLKEAQKLLREMCSKAIAEGAAAGLSCSIVKSNPLFGNAASGAVAGDIDALAIRDLRFRRRDLEAGAYNVRGSSVNSSLHSTLQQLKSQLDQTQVLPTAAAHLQLQDHHRHHQLVSRVQNDHLQAIPGYMDRSQQELKRRRLFVMLEESERRLKKYEEQMHVLVIALETSGVGLMLEGAAPCQEVAAQAVQKRFAHLRDAILAAECAIAGDFTAPQIGAASSQPLPGAGECDQAGSSAVAKFRLLDHQLRHQRALQQVGLFPQPPWRPQRGLPERSVSLLRAWLFDHFLHPYPKDTEKVLLARQTGLTRNQVSNWFINARVRLWKPMVEEMYLEEMRTSEKRRATGQGNAKKSNPTLTDSLRNTTAGRSELHVDQSKRNAHSDFGNHVMAVQDLGSVSVMQGLETSRFLYKNNEIISDSHPTSFHDHVEEEQVRFPAGVELHSERAAMSTLLDAAAQQCSTQTWPFIQHNSVSFDAQEQQHYCNSDISAALMRFGSSGGVTLTLGLQQHSSGGAGGGGSMNCAGPSSFERPGDDVNAAHRWCE